MNLTPTDRRAGRSAPLRRAALVAALAALLLATTATGASAANLFGPPTTYAAPGEGAPAAGDLDGDGRADLVTADPPAEGVSVRLGRPGGALAAPVDHPTGGTPSAIAIHDLDGDHQPDLAVANDDTNTVAVLLNTGGAGFGPPVQYRVGADPSSIGAADVDDDGTLDLVTTNSGASSVSVLRGAGNGTFSPEARYAAGSTPGSLALGDIDEDGRADLAFRTKHGVGVMLAKAGGGFEPVKLYDNGSIFSPKEVLLLDVDGDGHLDLLADFVDGIIGDEEPYGVNTRYGDGNGGFGGTVPSDVGCCTEFGSVAEGDVNGDGRPDLVLGDEVLDAGPPGGISLLRGWNGGFVEAGTAFFASGPFPDGVAVGDVDGDGHEDVITVGGQSREIDVLINTGVRETAATAASGPVTFDDRFRDTESRGRPVTITNVGNTFPLRTGAAGLVGRNPGQFRLTDSTCPGFLGPGDQCTVMVHFAPTTPGPKRASVEIPVPLEGVTHRVAVDGTGLAHVVKVRTSVAFGDQQVATVSGHRRGRVQVRNASNVPLTITHETLTGPDRAEFSIGADSCLSGPVAAGGTCAFTVHFAPPALGNYAAGLDLASDSRDSPRHIDLTGTGASDRPLITVHDGVAFGGLLAGHIDGRPVTVGNVGSGDLVISSFDLGGRNPHQFGVDPGTCAAPVPSGSTCHFTPRFTPTTRGAKRAGLTLSDNARHAPHRLTLTGTGIVEPRLALSPSSIAFGPQAPKTTSPEHDVTLTNTGNAPLHIRSLEIGGTNADQFGLHAGTCDAPVAPDASCAFQVDFTPPTAGGENARVRIGNDAAGSPRFVALSGTGTIDPLSAGRPLVSVDDAGDALFSWSAYETGGGGPTPVSAERGLSGATLDDPQDVAPVPGVSQMLAPDGTGAFQWTADGQTFARRRSATGGLAAPLRLDGPGGGVLPPAPGPDGSLVFAWDRDMRLTTRTLSGTASLTDPVSVVAFDQSHLLDAAFAVAPDGTALFAWVLRDHGTTWVQTRSLSLDGTLGPIQDVSGQAPATQSLGLALDGAGDATFVWERQDASGWTVQTRRRAVDGTLGAIADLTGPGPDAEPVMAVDPGDDAAFAWRRSDGTNRVVQTRVRAPDGSLGAVQGVSADGADAFRPQVGIDATGDATYAWTRSDGSGRVVQARRRDALTGLLGPIQDVSEAGADAAHLRLAVGSAGDAVLAWVRDFTAVEGRRLTAAGALGPVLDVAGHL